ncbi:hypothetical protein [Actinoplanes sp. NPDC049118]|uniref:hypothetical protein n=1 Tax=Actinoplanes sp. NPDC049118 TaxID=3155769 RepID=UPI0033C4A4CF
MTTFRGKATAAVRLIPTQIRHAGTLRFTPDPAPGHVYTAAGRRDWNFTTRLSAASNGVRFASDTSDHRFVISGLSLVMLLVGGAGFLTGQHDAQTVGLAFYVFVGIGGAPWVLAKRTRLPTRLAMTALTSLCVPTVVGLTMMALGDWRPAAVFVGLVVLSVPLHVYGCVTARQDRRMRGGIDAGPRDVAARARASRLSRLARKHGSVSLLLALAGGAMCLVAALTHRHVDPGLWGFLSVIGPLWYVGLALVLVSFAVSRADSDASVAVAVTILVLVLTATPALVYDGPRSQSAAKHVDFIQQIRTLHRLDTAVPVYNAWPGFFAAMAWVCDVAGIRDPMRLAICWPTLIGLFKLAGLRFLAGTVLTSRTAAWVAVALAVLADPIGADYFSPQSVGFVIGLISFAIALSHYHTPLKVIALTMAGCALAVSHQLSPYLVGGTLVILTLFRQVRPWWLPATVLGPAAIWALLNRGALAGFLDIGEVGNARNFRPPPTATANGLDRLPVVTLSAWALAAGILVLAVVAGLVVLRRWRSIEAWALAAAPAAGLAIIAVNPYGQEGIFRAALFGIPWLALLASQLFRRGDERRPNRPLLAVLSVLCVTFLTAAFGLDATNVIRPGDRLAFQYFAAHGVAGRTTYLLQIGPGDLPSTPPGADRSHVAVAVEELRPFGPGGPDEPAEQTCRRLTRGILAKSGDTPASASIYALWSPTSSYYGWEYGIDRPAHFAELRDAFRRSTNWTVVFQSGGSVLYRYRPGVT